LDYFVGSALIDLLVLLACISVSLLILGLVQAMVRPLLVRLFRLADCSAAAQGLAARPVQTIELAAKAFVRGRTVFSDFCLCL
jgi:hypothetical protein